MVSTPGRLAAAANVAARLKVTVPVPLAAARQENRPAAA
jgi:hypothetical protein